jgi:hypothetical protein
MTDPVDEATIELEDLSIAVSKIILCGCIAIPPTTRKRFRYKDKPNPNPYYDFSSYTPKQLSLIKKKFDCDAYKDELRNRLASDNRFSQFQHDLEHFYKNKCENY